LPISSNDVIIDLHSFPTRRSSDLLEKLAAHFKALGYEECGEYHFEAKKLYAKHYEHPDRSLPKVFISELLLDKCSDYLRETITADRKSTRLNSSHVKSSYAVFCLK